MSKLKTFKNIFEYKKSRPVRGARILKSFVNASKERPDEMTYLNLTDEQIKVIINKNEKHKESKIKEPGDMAILMIGSNAISIKKAVSDIASLWNERSTILTVKAEFMINETRGFLPYSIYEITDLARAYRPSVIHIENIHYYNNEVLKKKVHTERILEIIKAKNQLVRVARKLDVTEEILLVVSTTVPDKLPEKKSFTEAFPLKIALKNDI